MPRCRFHVSREMIPVFDPQTNHSGTAQHLHGDRIKLRCPIEWCQNVDVMYPKSEEGDEDEQNRGL